MATFRRIESQLTPNGQVRSGPRGAALDLSPLAKGLSDYAVVQEQRDTDQALFEARREMDQWERSAVFDPENGAVTRKGRDAFDLPKVLSDDFDKFSVELLDKIANQRARMAAQKLAQARREQITGWADRYTMGEREKFLDQQYQADILSMQENAVLFVNDPARLRTEMAAQADRTFTYLKGKGASEEVISAAMKENAGRTHSLVVGSLLTSGDAKGADVYLKANEGSMKPTDVLRLKAGMQETLIRERVQVFGDEVDKGGLTLPQALEKARATFSGPEEAAAVQEVKTRFSERQAITIEAQRDAADSAWKVITNGGSRKGIKPELWNSLGGEEQRQINDYVEARARRYEADAKRDFKTDMVAYYGLRRMAAEDPASFASLDLMKSKPLLEDTDFQRLVEVQASINKNDAKAMETQRVVKSTIGMIAADIKAAGIDLTPKEGSAQAKEAAAFMGAVTVALDEATRVKGSPLSAKEARDIGMGMLREGYEQGSGIFGMFQNKRRGYQIATDPDLAGKTFVATKYKDIPAEARDALVEELRASGVQLPRSIYGGTYVVSDEYQAAIERAYQRGKEQGVFR